MVFSALFYVFEIRADFVLFRAVLWARSTQQAMAELIDKISLAIKRNDYTTGIFLDLSKAFDTISHET